MFKQEIKDGTLCPRLDRVCEREKCVFWQKLEQRNIHTGEIKETWMCSDAMHTFLLQQINSKLNHNAAAVESMRNQIVERMDGQPKVVARLPKANGE